MARRQAARKKRSGRTSKQKTSGSVSQAAAKTSRYAPSRKANRNCPALASTWNWKNRTRRNTSQPTISVSAQNNANAHRDRRQGLEEEDATIKLCSQSTR